MAKGQSIKRALKNILYTPVSIFYPRKCIGCGKPISYCDNIICPLCVYELKRHQGTEMLKSLRLNRVYLMVDHVYAGYNFNRTTPSRNIIHQIKYHHCAEGGIELGKLLARSIGITNEDYDYIIPVPTHKRKEFARGYNQACLIAKGFSIVSGIPLLPRALIRTQYEKGQTTRNREQRLASIQNVFCEGPQYPAKRLRLLLLDDVVTTGTTISSAVEALIRCRPKKLGVIAATVAP